MTTTAKTFQIDYPGTLKLEAGTITNIPLPTGRGPWSVKLVRVLSVDRVYKDRIGMTYSTLTVTPEAG